MRRRLLGVSSLACIVGGAALLAPASAQRRPPTYCPDYVGKPCSTTGVRTMTCYHQGGGSDIIYCQNGTWIYV